MSKVVPQKLIVVWQDSNFRVHAVFYDVEFLSNSEQDVIKSNTKDFLFIIVRTTLIILTRVYLMNYQGRVITLTVLRFTWIM